MILAGGDASWGTEAKRIKFNLCDVMKGHVEKRKEGRSSVRSDGWRRGTPPTPLRTKPGKASALSVEHMGLVLTGS